MVRLFEASRNSYFLTLRGPPAFRMGGFLEALGFRMVGLLKAPRFSNDWTFGGFAVFLWLYTSKALRLPYGRSFRGSSGFRIVGILRPPPGFRMVGILEVLQYSYGWILRGHPVFIWLIVLRTSGFRMVELLESNRFSYGLTLRLPTDFLRLESQRLTGIFEVVHLGASRFSYGWTLRGPPVFVWLDS